MKEEAKERIKQINIKVGNNLLKARLAAGYSRTQLAKKGIYVNQQQINKYEKAGKNSIPIGRLVLLAEALEIDLFSLLDGIKDDKPINKVKGSRALCRKIARDAMKVKSRDQQQIIHKIILDIIDTQDVPKE
ncbi:HTH_XRE domain containing protein [uncultured Caudovirales phage]|uniref:HTH_XRE domain containing protein n=1 Tax=uncultured Caudovirales phage TaxID=2100421 RepID=A0A6J5KQJ0_9CAUD|nr:HTH_XRE domain containing protein [uncultured Caudovirales phage]CAB4241002.1 HTH_XRE domain containing protein [uncultured Caudovirales phage]